MNKNASKKEGSINYGQILWIFYNIKTSNVEENSYIPDLNYEPNEDMEEELVDDLEILDHDKKGQDSSSSSLRRRKIKHPWVYSINVEDGKTHMKCRLCEKYKAQGPWGVGNGCNTIQYDDVITHSKSSNHQTSIQKKNCMKLKGWKSPFQNI